MPLQERSLLQAPFAGRSIDTLTWWFWIKAGMGFTIGVGSVYLAWSLFWIYLLTHIPELVILRTLTRF